jgi:NADPH2:quinone reductase
MKSMAILVPRNGGPDVLDYREVDVPPPGPGEVQIRQTAIGLNYIDTYFRSGLYPPPAAFPYIAGEEGAGTVLAVGPDVTEFREGDRVAYPAAAGAYCAIRNVAAAKIVSVPDGIALETAAGMMMKGMTAEYLLNRTYKVGPDTVLLFHAAAGGVGLIAGQWAKALGATVIGTAGGPEKVALAKRHGYDHVIDYNNEDFVTRVKDITGGKGVDVVYDSVGRDTFPMSLDCLKVRGLWVSFGQSSGAIDPIKISILAQKGSLYATRPMIFSYIRDRKELDDCANALFSVVRTGKVVINIGQTYPLADAARAHADLENRRTSGTTLLIP